MRKALAVGVDYYEKVACLTGCVNDALAVKAVLERNADGTANFATPRTITSSSSGDLLTKASLTDAVRELFAGSPEIALFYFAGHGYIEDTGGYLCAGDCRDGDDGLPLSSVMTFARDSRAKNKVIILDSCFSGVLGNRSSMQGFAEISDGMTILTASTEEQYAAEIDGGGAGVFTTLLVDALDGAAANLVGEVTPGSIYAHIDQSLGPWAQRPVFKTNVQTFVSLRKAKPPIPLVDLQAIVRHFPSAGFRLQLDPAFEPERSTDDAQNLLIPKPNPVKTEIFAVLQRYAKVNLLRPVDAPHMWHAAMQSKWCELTVLGEHYRKLVNQGLI